MLSCIGKTKHFAASEPLLLQLYSIGVVRAVRNAQTAWLTVLATACRAARDCSLSFHCLCDRTGTMADSSAPWCGCSAAADTVLHSAPIASHASCV